jgi:hypothetical protein
MSEEKERGVIFTQEGEGFEYTLTPEQEKEGAQVVADVMNEQILAELKEKSIAEEIQAEVEAEVAEEMQLESELTPVEKLGEELLESTEEEKRQKFIQAVKESHLRYKPKKHFGVAYKAERKRKNKAQRKSRKLNR